ncbi:MAG: hypothetical protein H7Y43_06690 [Akkermansiaceae bacterium]|nr:hypothetical protein [Verrucomicrobiales bacterium]
MIKFSISICVLLGLAVARAGNLDTIGVTLLRTLDPALRGNGVNIVLVEALETANPPAFQANPSIAQSSNLITFHSGLGTSSVFPNNVGAESGHANNVAAHFFGTFAGVAPEVSQVDNYEAGFFFNSVVAPLASPPSSARIVNQSFIFQQSSDVEQIYDDYASRYNVLFVSGASFIAGQVRPAASAYNGIGVGVSDISNPPFGPTLDGRCKPDLVAPGAAASFSTPYVAGSAAVLLQAALRGDAGPGTSSATNLITLKALLLNGAIKPTGWTNSPTAPLDHRKGAGVVNVFNSRNQLKGGKHAPVETTTVTTQALQWPGTNLNNLASTVGWDDREITTSTNTDEINHYYFHLPGSNAYTLTATLVWNRQQNQTNLNDLNLFLYDISNSNQFAASVSLVDNVEHLWLPQLPPGRYDLRVLKRGSTNQVSAAETYALAFEFFNLPLEIALTNETTLALTWPVVPTGFTLFSTPSLTPPIWTAVNTPVLVDTNTAQNSVLLPAEASSQFFRLQRP